MLTRAKWMALTSGVLAGLAVSLEPTWFQALFVGASVFIGLTSVMLIVAAFTGRKS